MEDISFIGSYSLYWKPFILVEIILLVEGISGSGSHFSKGKPFFVWKLLPVVEIIPFSRSNFFLVEAAPFNRNFSFQWKPFCLVFQHFRQQKLSLVT